MDDRTRTTAVDDPAAASHGQSAVDDRKAIGLALRRLLLEATRMVERHFDLPPSKRSTHR